MEIFSVMMVLADESLNLLCEEIKRGRLFDGFLL